MNMVLLNTAYFPPISYMARIKASRQVHVEQHEHYGKQSYRNRCDILTANGVISLTVPVKKGAQLKTLTKEVQVDYDTPWQREHFRGIESAYKKSPYYDYYIDSLHDFFERKERYLIDLNEKILQQLLELISMERPLLRTSDYIRHPEDCPDFREVIHPKASRRIREDDYIPKPYYQTFAERFPFTPNLSILDLLFNTGPEASLFI